MKIEEKVKNLIESKLNENDIFIDKIEYIKEDNNFFLRIIIDSKDIVDVDTCVKATKIINPILDENNIIENSYILDVTSKEKGDKFE